MVLAELRKDLAEREAETVKLRNVLFASDELLRSLENSGGFYGLCVMEANQAVLSTPPSTSYLEQWEHERYGEPVGHFFKNHNGFLKQAGDPIGFPDMLPLYTRKD
jgi:hypothetical protein